MSRFVALLRRELLLAIRHGSDTVAALLFFLLAASLFPLAIGPAPETLGRLAPGIVYVCALLAARGLHFDATTYETDATWSYADLDEAEEVLAESLLVTARPGARARVREWAGATLVAEEGRLVAPHHRMPVGIATLRPAAAPRRAVRSASAEANGWQSF